jgi:hypothetical protein
MPIAKGDSQAAGAVADARWHKSRMHKIFNYLERYPPTPEEADRLADLAERAQRVVDEMPPPTDEQLRRLAIVWPPRPDGAS